MGERVRKEPGCETCRKREDCALARDGAFCAGWQSAEPRPAGTDPNEAWRKGEESPWD